MLATISIDLRKIVPLKDRTFVFTLSDWIRGVQTSPQRAVLISWLNQMIKSPVESVAKDSQEVTSGCCLDEMKTCPHTVPFQIPWIRHPELDRKLSRTFLGVEQAENSYEPKWMAAWSIMMETWVFDYATKFIWHLNLYLTLGFFTGTD